MGETESKGCLLVIMFAGVVLLAAAGYRYQLSNLKVEAVQRGYAEYVVDQHGNATWQWIELPDNEPLGNNDDGTQQ